MTPPSADRALAEKARMDERKSLIGSWVTIKDGLGKEQQGFLTAIRSQEREGV